jgi:hypothetical protein
MEKLEKILEMWQSDSIIDQTEPGRELVRIPSLHSKYLNILTNHRIASKRAHFEYMKMRKIKLEYFSGKLSKDELEKYGWEQFPFTLKAEINTYMEADLDLIKFLEKKSYHDEAISVVEAIINELKQRTWQLRSFIDYEKFINGQ